MRYVSALHPLPLYFHFLSPFSKLRNTHTFERARDRSCSKGRTIDLGLETEKCVVTIYSITHTTTTTNNESLIILSTAPFFLYGPLLTEVILATNKCHLFSMHIKLSLLLRRLYNFMRYFCSGYLQFCVVPFFFSLRLKIKSSFVTIFSVCYRGGPITKTMGLVFVR